jgi:hypothetical protein
MVAADEAERGVQADLKTRLAKVEDDVATIKQRLWFVAGVASAAGGGIGSAIAAVLSR